MTEFDDLTKRILSRLDSLDDKIEKLCERVMKVEYELKSHLKMREKKHENNEKKFYIIIACMGIAFTLIEIYQNFI